jgi:hypothetical protein
VAPAGPSGPISPCGPSGPGTPGTPAGPSGPRGPGFGLAEVRRVSSRLHFPTLPRTRTLPSGLRHATVIGTLAVFGGSCGFALAGSSDAAKINTVSVAEVIAMERLE